jgi:hypothetical protein
MIHKEHFMTRMALAAVAALALVAAPVGGARAELATETEAAMVAANWATHIAAAKGDWGGSQDPTISGTAEIVVADTLLGWCFYVAPSGHIVVPVIKELPPVKSYSEEYGMSIGDPDGYSKLIEDVLRNRVRTLKAAYGSMEATEPARGGRKLGVEHRLLWDRFAVPAGEFDSESERGALGSRAEVGPLLTTSWHQGAPYNNLCPMGDGGRTVVGCVATAAAQILRYHGSPFAGYGSHCYYWSGDSSCGGSTSGQTLCAYYDDEYEWDNMPNACGGCSPEEAAAVSELCYEVGVAFNMGYGHCGSGAYTADALDVFPTYFGYSSAIDRENRSYHTPTSWFNVIKEEINLSRPMQYRILGHSIVCDGWRDTGGTNQYHMNYGWADSHNAWYVIDNLYISDDPNDEYLIRRIIPPDAPWEDVTGGLPIADTGNAMGVSWCDYDDDGDLDLYFTNDGTANVLARNDASAGFTDVTPVSLGDTGAGAAAVWGDYDNDGDPDLYLVNTGSANRLFRSEGSGTFTDVTAGALGDAGDGYGAAWADYDQDGDLDIYVANSGSANILLRNDGGGAFSDATAGPLADAGAGRGVAWSDYDNDGDPDLYLANFGSANVLLRNDGGAFTDVTAGPLGDSGNSTGVAWADYDGDGDTDLYVSNYGSANALLRNDDGTFVDVTSGPLGDAGNGTGVAWGDYDKDGDPDLYVVNDGQANALLRNIGTDTFIDVTTAPLDDGGAGQGAAWGDFDRDGRLDLVLMNRGSGNLLFRSRMPNTAHFLHVTLEGTVSNRSGIGARIRIVTDAGVQYADVTGGSGYLSQASLPAEFGLGWETEVDTLEIHWPSGIVNRYVGLSGDQFTHFLEIPPPSAPTGLAADPMEAGVGLTWLPVADPQFAHFRVERDTSAAFGPLTITFTTADTSYVDFPIIEVRDYHYRVVAVGTGGNDSDPSGVVVAAPLQTQPDLPQDLIATPGDALIDLDWSDVASPDLDHYVVERSTSPTFDAGLATFDAWLSEMTDGPLATDDYHYRVFAVDWGDLMSAPSETVSASPLVVPPSAPAGLIAESDDGVVHLEWDTNPELDVERYIVYRDTVRAAGDSLAAGPSTQYDDADAQNYTVYWYSVEAVDTGGLRSARSDTVAGLAAPGGAVFVDCSYSGFENGSYSYPYSLLEDGIAHADSGAVVLLLPSECGGNIVIDEKVMVLGVYGSSVTRIVSSGGSALLATAGSDSATIQGLTIDGLGSAQNAIECTDTSIRIVDCVLTRASAGANVHTGAAPEFVRTEFSDNYYGLTCADTATPVLSGNTFHGNGFANISNTGSVGPLVGGSLSAANDFLDNAFFSVFNTGTAVVSAEYNCWASACVDSAWFYGPVDFVPWTDSLHVQTYDECPGTGVEDGLPARYALGRNVPNPFNPVTRIAYDVPAPGARVTLRVYSVGGALVAVLVDERVDPGRHVAVWDGTDTAGRSVASGVYFYRLEAGDFADQRKMVLMK